MLDRVAPAHPLSVFPTATETLVSLRRHSLAALALCVALATTAACSSGTRSPSGRVPGSSLSSHSTTTTIPRRAGIDGTLVIGALVPISGAVAPIADSFTAPVKLAIDEMNFAGGVGDKPVGLAIGDDGSDAAAAIAAFTTLTDTDHVDAIVGPSSSDIAAELIPPVRKAQVVICSGSNSAGALSTIDSDGYYFRTAPPDKLQADALAKLVIADGHRAPVILAVRDSYGVPFGRIVRARLRALGASAVRLADFTPDGDATAIVKRALRPAPDSVVLIGFPAATAPVIRALAAAGKGPGQIPTYASDGLQAADLGALVDPANPAIVAGLKGTTPAGSPSGIDHPFNARILAAGVEPFFSAAAYDCTILIGLAAVGAGTDDPAMIRRHFAANLTGKVDCSTFLDCRTLLAAHRTIHYRGASSRFEDWKGFEPGTGVYDLWTMGLDARPVTGAPTNQIAVP